MLRHYLSAEVAVGPEILHNGDTKGKSKVLSGMGRRSCQKAGALGFMNGNGNNQQFVDITGHGRCLRENFSGSEQYCNGKSLVLPNSIL